MKLKTPAGVPGPVIGNFMRVDRLHHSCCENAIRQTGTDIHRNQFGMLMFLCHSSEDISQKDIAEHFNVSGAAVANTLKALEQDGYIERKSDASDTRKNIVEITPKGIGLLETTCDAFYDIDKAMISGITDEELRIFNKCLDAMADNLKAYVGKEKDK